MSSLQVANVKDQAVPELQIALLGTFAVLRDNVPITVFPTDKVRALLALLVTETDRSRTRSSLVTLLWPDQPEDMALRNLSQTLVRLRKTIGDTSTTLPFLTVTRTTLQWNRASNSAIDVERFTCLCQSDETSDLAEAVALYRGDFLSGFTVSDSEPFDEWQTLTRERLQQQVLIALNTLTERALAAGNTSEAERYARQQISLEPWREEAHRQVMGALAASGQRAAALAHYEVCRRILHDALAIEPDPTTIALYDHISAGQNDATVSHARVVPVTRARHAERHAENRINLPAALTSLIGRRDELDKLIELIEHSDERLVTIVGQGGVGKTRLALAAATEMQQAFADGVCWVPLAGITAATHDHAAQIAAAIMIALRLPSVGPDDSATQCIQMLRQQDMLLVLDNMEHLLEGTDFVVSLLQMAPKVRILVTSRERLRVPAEYVVQLSGLPLPPSENTRDAANYSAVAMFLERAKREVRDFGQDLSALPSVVRLCRIVDGLPLGIELASHWVAHYSCDEISHAITTNIDFLSTSARGYPARHRSLRAVFAYSWDMLTPEKRQTLMRLSVFRGLFDRAAAQAITEASPHVLASLVDMSLLQRVAVGGYTMHELLRQFAVEQFTYHPAAHTANMDRHAAYYIGWIASHSDELSGPQQQTVLATIEKWLENIQAAWVWAVRQENTALIAQAIMGLCLFYEQQGRYQQGITACDLVIAQFDRAERSDNSALALGLALAWKAAFTIALQQFLLSRTLLERSLAILHALDAQHARAFTWYTLGQLEFEETNLPEVRRCLDESIALYRIAGDKVGTAMALSKRGRLAWLMAEYTEARSYFNESLTIYRSRADRRGTFQALSNLALVMVLEGQVDAGLQLFEESQTLAQTLDDPLELAEAQRQLGRALFYIGRYPEAQMHYAACVAIDNAYDTQRMGIQDRIMLGLVLLMLKAYDEVTALAQTMVLMALELGLQRDAGYALMLTGLAALGRDEYATARDVLQDTLMTYIVQNTADDQIFSLFGLSQAHRLLSDLPRARQAAMQALYLAEQSGSTRGGGMAIAALACVLADEGAIERAVELEALVMRGYGASNSGFFRDLVTEPIAAHAAHLPADVVAAARAHGLARSIIETVAELRATIDS